MLHTRLAKGTVQQDPIGINTTRGYREGEILTTLLWSLVVDEVLVKLDEIGILCKNYADDIVIFAIGSFKETLYDLIGES